MITNKTIFISALDWGLGHASRCVSIIRSLEKDNKIIIGVTPLTEFIFDEEFPHIQKIKVPAYNIRYSKYLPIWLKLIFDWKRISKIIKQEKQELEKIIFENKIDVVISDNRFGLYSEHARSILITHQLFLKTQWFLNYSQRVNKKFILNFPEVWVPDFEEKIKCLSGELSHGKHFHGNVKYIGIQSRLEKSDCIEKKFDYLFLISGPEPQQTIFKNFLIEKAKKNQNLKFAIVCPNDTKSENQTLISGMQHIEMFVSPNKKKISEVILQSHKIICRSGYSTLMDLYALGKKNIILIPTPGQPEQEYLAEYWQKNFDAKNITQSQLNLMD